MEPVYIVSTARTPIGSFLSSLSGQTYVDLGAHAVKGEYREMGLIQETADGHRHDMRTRMVDTNRNR